MAARRVLLFGASGFLGQQVFAALSRDPRAGTIVRVGRQVTDTGWVGHDLVHDTGQQLAELLRSVEPDTVINCAGRLTGSTTDLVEANVLVTARLLDAVAAGAPAARLVVIGSAAEYGVVPVGRPVGEDDPTDPVGIYGITRLAGTQLVRLAVDQGSADAVALRVFNPIGPGLPVENLLGRAADSMRTAIEQGHDHITLGPLGAYRDFVDVRDVAAAVCAAGLAEQVKQPVLNVGSGLPVLIREAVETLAEVAGFHGQIRESAAPPVRSSSVNWIAADLSRINQTLGWAPTYDLSASVQAIWGG